MPESQIVTVKFDGDTAWITLDNPPVNATSTKLRKALKKAIGDVADCRVAILACAGKTFVAGGDLTEFDAPAQEPLLPDVVQMIEDSSVPFLAAMHGTVFGGGFEIALACSWRIAVQNTRFGLPEVHVGIVPGAGGSQRLPRLVGMEAAIDIECRGKVIGADQLKELGGLDQVFAGDLHNAAVSFIRNLPIRPPPVSSRSFEQLAQNRLDDVRAELVKSAKGQKSPVENLDALMWASLPFDEGQPKERALHMALRHSPESRALRHVFFSERRTSKPSAIQGLAPEKIEHLSVVGGGLMGAGIATAALNAGLSVTMIERDAATATAGHDRVASLLDGAVRRGKLSDHQKKVRLGKFSAANKFSAAAKTDIAIEAVFEGITAKQDVFRRIAEVVTDDTILATNTSYLDPDLIFAGIPHPARCLGLHFFSPAHIMKLLEVVNTSKTDPGVLATAFGLAKSMGKIPVLSGICDGFIGNRMLAAYRRAADYMLADGALPFQIDAAMRAFGMPMGPYELQDLTGLQIAWANRKRLAPNRGLSERYVSFADQLCEMGRMGQRSGLGWYQYEEGSRFPIRDPFVENLIIAGSNASAEFSSNDIQQRLMAVLANEGALIVQDGIAENVASIDVVQINGYGFPRWRGGPMRYAAEIGWESSARMMETVAADSPGSWRLAELEIGDGEVWPDGLMS